MEYNSMTYEELLIELENKEKRINQLTEEVRQLESIANTDFMTGVLSRRCGLNKLKESMEKSIKNKENLIVCFIDIDKLKIINDSFGHDEGDKLLKIVTDIIEKSVRKKDYIFRMGGDEFILVFTDTNMDEVDVICNDIDKRINYINKKRLLKFGISVSKGLAKFDFNKNTTLEELVKQADREMYKDKLKNYTDGL